MVKLEFRALRRGFGPWSEKLWARGQVDKDVRSLPGQPNVVVPCLSPAFFADRRFTTDARSTVMCQNPTWTTGSPNWSATAGVTGRIGGHCGRWALPCEAPGSMDSREQHLEAPKGVRPPTSTTTLPSILNQPGGNVILHTAARVEIAQPWQGPSPEDRPSPWTAGQGVSYRWFAEHSRSISWKSTSPEIAKVMLGTSEAPDPSRR